MRHLLALATLFGGMACSSGPALQPTLNDPGDDDAPPPGNACAQQPGAYLPRGSERALYDFERARRAPHGELLVTLARVAWHGPLMPVGRLDHVAVAPGAGLAVVQAPDRPRFPRRLRPASFRGATDVLATVSSFRLGATPGLWVAASEEFAHREPPFVGCPDVPEAAFVAETQASSQIPRRPGTPFALAGLLRAAGLRGDVRMLSLDETASSGLVLSARVLASEGDDLPAAKARIEQLVAMTGASIPVRVEVEGRAGAIRVAVVIAPENVEAALTT